MTVSLRKLLRTGKALQILEFGVQHGASIRALAEYFGERAIIYGVDLSIKAISGLGERVRGIVADQSKEDSLAALVANLERDGTRLDLVIDDCTH